MLSTVVQDFINVIVNERNKKIFSFLSGQICTFALDKLMLPKGA